MIKFKTLRQRIFAILSLSIIIVAGSISFYLIYDLKTRAYTSFSSVTETINNALVANTKEFVYKNNKTGMQYAIESIKSPYISNIFILNSEKRVMVSQKKYEREKLDKYFNINFNSNKYVFKNDKQHLIFTTFHILDVPIGYLVVEANLNYYLKGLSKSLKGLIIMIFSFLLLTLSIVFFLSRNLSQPLYNIIKTLEETKHNEELIFKEESEKEFSYLSNNISQKHNALLLLNTQLEEKVHQKTIELQAVNKNLEKKIDKAVKDAKSKEQLFHQQTRLAQIGEMISMIAHQWRQPLTAISSNMMLIDLYVESEKYDLANETERKEFIEFLKKKHNNIYDHIEYLSSTTDDFRNLFNPNTKKILININSPLDKALKLISTPIKNKNINLTLNLKSLKNCELYENEIMQVILNILKNASDSLIESSKKEKHLSIETYDTQTHSIIKICDNGMGIPLNIQDKIFDPYFSTKNQKMGTGLGLYMSKNIIEDHNNGKLEFNTNPHNTCFLLTFKHK